SVPQRPIQPARCALGQEQDAMGDPFCWKNSPYKPQSLRYNASCRLPGMNRNRASIGSGPVAVRRAEQRERHGKAPAHATGLRGRPRPTPSRPRQAGGRAVLFHSQTQGIVMSRLLAAVLVFLLAQDEFRMQAHVITKRLQGRILASKIETGMTQEQVDKTVSRTGIFLSGTLHGYLASYGDYGFRVLYTAESDGTFSVKEVDFDPLLAPWEVKRLLRHFHP